MYWSIGKSLLFFRINFDVFSEEFVLVNDFDHMEWEIETPYVYRYEKHGNGLCWLD